MYHSLKSLPLVGGARWSFWSFVQCLIFLGSLLYCVAALSTTPVSASPLITTDPFPADDPFGISPFWDWKTIESDHFRISFPNELQVIAQRSATYLEEAHALLSPVLRWEPKTKTQILVLDNSDSANGLTTPLGRFGIVLWVTPPESWQSPANYDDWLRLLIIHEYTHLLNMDTTRGYSEIGRLLFGDIFLPNSLWSPWMLEGLAVFMETRFSQAGRGRSTFYDMVLRAAVEEKSLDSESFITLDKVAGDNPYFPFGDTRYQFGYHLMNTLSQQTLTDPSLTLENQTQSQKQNKNPDVFGLMSERSSCRIPFFINGNLENLISKNWNDLWKEWVTQTLSRTHHALQILKTAPLSQVTVLTPHDHQTSHSVLGSAASPDGQWLAYTLSSSDQRSGLFLKNLHTGTTTRLDDKMNGVSMSFTPDSKTLLYSEFRQKNIYYLFSDIHAYSLETQNFYALTESARVRDPNLSRDGKTMTFTQAKQGHTELAIAEFLTDPKQGRYYLGPIQSLYIPNRYDHIDHPQFSADGKTIFFTLHPNGKFQEDLMAYDLVTRKTRVLIQDGFLNQFPAVSLTGDLYFISNKTGVSNLYRFADFHQDPVLMSNVLTGLSAPTFSLHPASTNQVYLTFFSTAGWDLAQLELPTPQLQAQWKPQTLTIPRPPAPKTEAKPILLDSEKTYPVSDYSVFPSILPRGWLPLLQLDSQGLTGGAEVLGFDATNRHRYVFAGAYASQLQVADGYALYSNRSFGPELSFSTYYSTSNIQSTPQSFLYTRNLNFTTDASFPILWTYSSLTPHVGINLSRNYYYETTADPSVHLLQRASTLIFSVDQLLSFSNLETSPLGVVPEGGRSTQLGMRTYFLPGNPVFKGLFIDREYIRLSKHVVLSPSFKSIFVSRLNTDYLTADTVTTGRNAQTLLDSMGTDGFSQLAIRGYPNTYFLSKTSSIGAFDLFFPIARIFRGWGTQPIFLENLYGFVFSELGYLPGFPNSGLLPSAGGGVRLLVQTFSNLYTTLSLEYHQGFAERLRGSQDLFFQFSLAGLPI